MMAIIKAKLLLLKRKPGGFIATTIICIAFAFIMGMSSSGKVVIPVYSSMPNQPLQKIVKELNQGDAYQFKIEDKKLMMNRIAEGKAELGVELNADHFTIYRVSDSQNLYVIDSYLEGYYREMLQKQGILEIAKNKTVGKGIIEKLEHDKSLVVHSASYKDHSDPVYNQSLQGLFGFALFFSIFTVAFHVVEILKDKRDGIWDRLIISPTKKIQVYLAHLIFAFLIGYLQISLIFIILKFGAGIDFYGGLAETLVVIIPYLFAIVALAILLTGLVKTMSQYNAIVPLISVSMAMVGGAYWPIEIVSSKVILAISKVVPITYGMELLKGVTISGQSFSELTFPILILLLMGIVMMGVGISLIERRHV